jgi:hypothetical protein
MVSISKSIDFIDRKNQFKKLTKIVLNIDKADGEIVGEDPLWFSRPNNYSVKVVSNMVKAL